MKYNIVTFGKKNENFEMAIKTKTIGSFQSTFKEYIGANSLLFLHCNSLIWGTAIIDSEYFYSEDLIWDDKVYPHRFKITKIEVTNKPIMLSDGHYNKLLRDEFGTGWAYKFIFSPKPLPLSVGKDLLSDFECRPKVAIEQFKTVF